MRLQWTPKTSWGVVSPSNSTNFHISSSGRRGFSAEPSEELVATAGP